MAKKRNRNTRSSQDHSVERIVDRLTDLVIRSARAAAVQPSPVSTQEVCVVGSLSNKNQHADMRIHIYEFELPAHSVVLAAQSDYFDKALDSEMKEGQTKSIHFNEEVRMRIGVCVFEYMYTGTYREDLNPILQAEGTYKGDVFRLNADFCLRRR
jgi:hypothetical protein